ncbi:MAG: glycosyltransferase [Candidatus Verstraetearchaeota archaeon]|nr:glycosyltransferase [Candidatus Verstraetearchaeota archaeon]
MSCIANSIYLVTISHKQSTLLNKYVYCNKQNDKQTTIIFVKKNIYSALLFKTFEYLKIQFILTTIVLKLRRKCSIIISVINGTTLIFPIIVARMLGKSTLSVVTGPTYLTVKKQKGKVLGMLFYLIEIITLSITKLIVVESPAVLKCYSNIRNIKRKVICILPSTNIESFQFKKQIYERKYQVGYIGRLSEEKGVIQFVYALKIIRQRYIKDLEKFKAIIIGSGPLQSKINNLIKNNDLENLVDMIGNIEHESLPEYINDIQLLVLPSFGEGVPRIVLESLACGTPVLSTQVGGISDILRNGETGFILKTNDPEEIAERIYTLLKEPKILQKASHNSLLWIKENYSEDVIIKKWKIAINSLYR